MPDASPTLFNTSVPLTPNQARLLQYIRDNPEQVVFLTTAQLADAVSISEATVVRLAQVLGYSGYKEMKHDLSRFIMNRLDTAVRLKSSARGIRAVGDLMDTVVQQDLKSLTTLAQALDMEKLCEVAQILHQAERTYLVGLRSAYSLAVFFKSGLSLIGRQVHLLTPETWELWRDVAQIGKRDVLFAISFPRYTRLTVEVAQAVHQTGTTVISLTDSALSPLSAYSHHLLFAPCRIDSFIESYVPALSVLNALITGIGFLKGSGAIDHLQKMEKVWDQKRIYQQTEVRSLPSWVGPRRRQPKKGKA